MSHASWCFACIGRREPPGGKARIIDWLDGTHAHEVKSGFVAFDRRIVTQIEKDAALKASGKRVKAYTWHFVASARSGSIGADPGPSTDSRSMASTTSSTCPERGRVKYEDMTESEAAAAFEEFMG